MPVTQREFDIVQLESQIKVQKLYQTWLEAFLGGRLAPPPQPANGVERSDATAIERSEPFIEEPQQAGVEVPEDNNYG